MLATIGLIIDIAIIIAIVIFSIIGLKKGLFKTVLSLLSWSVCIVIAIFTAKYVASWINGLYDFSSLIGKSISKSLIKTDQFFAQPINTFEAGGKTALFEASQNVNMNSFMKQLIKAVFSNSKVDMASSNTIGFMVGSSLGHICMIVISGILVFIVLKILTALLSKLFDNLAKTKVIGGLNKILGCVLGLLKGALIVITINIVLVGLSMMPAVNKLTSPIIKNTHVEKVIYKTTDKYFEKYLIDGDVLDKWIDNLWENRK